MPNEDDTFNLLRRTPVSELHDEYVMRQWEFYNAPDVFAVWLLMHGWNEDAFYTAGGAHVDFLRRRHGYVGYF